MRKVLLAAGFVFLFAGSRAQYVSLNKTELQHLKTSIKEDTAANKIFLRIRSKAESALNDSPQPVAEIASQGLLMGDPKKMASLKALQDVDKIFSLALTWAISGEDAYLKKTGEFLKAWADVHRPDGNPINETKLEELLFAYDLIKEVLPGDEKAQVDKWLERMITAELSHESAKSGRSTAVNNWNSHRVKMITMIAFILQRPDLQKKAELELKKQLEDNLNEDGSTFDFYERDALHYHIYSVEPLLKAAIVFRRAAGKDYFNYSTSKSASLKKSTDFLVPFMMKEKSHKEFQNSRVAFDRKRAANNEKGYIIADFIPSRGIVVLSQAIYFNQVYLKVIEQASAGKTSLNWSVLVNTIRTWN